MDMMDTSERPTVGMIQCGKRGTTNGKRKSFRREQEI
jgi:hypothetical protein